MTLLKRQFEYHVGNDWAYCDADDDERHLAALKRPQPKTRARSLTSGCSPLETRLDLDACDDPYGLQRPTWKGVR